MPTVDAETDAVRRLPQRFDSAERERRIDLAAACRLAALEGFDDALQAPFAARLPSDPEKLLVTPCGLLFEEVTASSLVVIDPGAEGMGGEGQDEGAGPVYRAGLAAEAAILAARPDVGAVLLTHTLAGMTVAAMECGLLPINQISLEFHNRIAVHDYEGMTLRPADADALTRDLGTREAMILRNHGLLTVGRTLAEAWRRMHYLELACRLQVAALGSGQQLRLAYPALAEFTARQYDGDAERGRTLWRALLRKLDRIDPGYRA